MVCIPTERSSAKEAWECLPMLISDLGTLPVLISDLGALGSLSCFSKVVGSYEEGTNFNFKISCNFHDHFTKNLKGFTYTVHTASQT